MFARNIYKDRRKRFESRVKQAGFDRFLIGSREGIFYLTGASYVPEERPFFILLSPEKDPVLIVPELERAHMQKAGLGVVKSYAEFPALKGEGWADLVLSSVSPGDKIGVEPCLSLAAAGELSGLNLVPAGLLEEMRQVKTPEEIIAIEKTARWADLGMKEILKASYFGATVVEIFSRARAVQAKVIRDTSYDPMESAFLMASWPAPFSAQPHGIPGVGDRMGKGPLVAISYLRVNGYAAEVERTYFHHPPTTEERDHFHQMTEARALGVSMVRHGISCHEIDEAVYAFLLSRGYKDYLLHRTGHGIGLGNHEGPYLARGSRDILAENMVISIEPGIYIPEIGGFRHSDTYLVTRDGCRALTRSPDQLEDLVITDRKIIQRMKGWAICRSLGLKERD